MSIKLLINKLFFKDTEIFNSKLNKLEEYIKSLEQERDILRDSLDNSRNKVADLEAEFEVLANKYNKILFKEDYPISINFSLMKVFSIEREYRDEKITTIIGYLDNKGRVEEWFLTITDDQHKELVKEFNKVVKGETE